VEAAIKTIELPELETVKTESANAQPAEQPATQPAAQSVAQPKQQNEKKQNEKQQLDLLTLVVQPTWREFLTDLVAREKINPWDVDVCAVADAYLNRLRSLQAMDLRVPANVILACSILLRLKANTLLVEDDDGEAQGETATQLIEEEIPSLVLRPDRPRSRRVTLSELLNAVEDVMRAGKRFTPLPASLAQVLELETPTENMGERMENVLGQAQELKDAEGLLMFSALVQAARSKLNGRAPPRYADSVVSHLLPVLHLVQEQKLSAWQDEFFGEIFLRLIDVEEEKRKEQAVLAAKAEESASAL
jgi:chromatin segregation and condensation protein Rec8/ScpA/Scc1 (kleisin family)